jgi:hypothetical protein
LGFPTATKRLPFFDLRRVSSPSSSVIFQVNLPNNPDADAPTQPGSRQQQVRL